MTLPASHQEVIDLWPTKAEFGRAIGVSEQNARQMYRSGIPWKHLRATSEALERAGFVPLTYAQLLALSKTPVD